MIIKDEPMSDDDSDEKLSKLEILSNTFGPQENKVKRKKLSKEEKQKILNIEKVSLHNLHKRNFLDSIRVFIPSDEQAKK
jgi:hypothetical protein